MMRIALLALILMSSAAAAQNNPSYSEVRLIPGYMTERGQYLAGVEIAMAPGWKTYWREPGEGGIPPIFEWSGSVGVTQATIEWPVPQVFETYGLRSLGYYDRVVFPVLFDVAESAQQADLKLALSYGLCSDICIPAYSQTAASMSLTQDMNVDALADARARTTTQADGVTARCSLVPAANAWRLDAQITSSAGLSPDLVAVFETNDPDLWIGTPDAVQQGDGLLFSAPMDWFGEGAFALARDEVRITLVESGRSAVEFTGC